MNVMPYTIRARWGDVSKIVDLVTDTLYPTPIGSWLVPDDDQRRVVLSAVARIWTEHALLVGEAHMLPDRTAAAIWFHRYRPIPEPVEYRTRLAAACGDHVDRLSLLDRVLRRQRPADPHNHLAFLAVPPGPRRAERSAAVLTASQLRIDPLGLPAYVEAFTPTQRELYGRHGYHGGDSFTLPDGTAVQPMWRGPRGRAAPLPINGVAEWSIRRPPGRPRNGRVGAWSPR
ncbi:hypothetical protein JNW88_17340 [Micromonospora sp. ATA32]|nr:hypothetical protein [Micromonospora sp. ATA32]